MDRTCDPTVSQLINVLSRYGHEHEMIRQVSVSGWSEEDVLHLAFYLCYHLTRSPDVGLAEKLQNMISQSYTRYFYVCTMIEAFIDNKVDPIRREAIRGLLEHIEMTYLNNPTNNLAIRAADSAEAQMEPGEIDEDREHFEMAIEKLVRIEYCEQQKAFFRSLFCVSRDLKAVEAHKRDDYLELQLFMLNFELNKRRLIQPQFESKSSRFLRQGIMIGFTHFSNSNMVGCDNQIVKIHREQFRYFETKTKCPFLVFIETVE